MNEETSQNNNIEQVPPMQAVPVPEQNKTETSLKVPEQLVEKTENGYQFPLSPIRTFGDDVKNAVQNENISTSKIFMAEQKRRDEEQKDEDLNDIKQKPNIVKMVLSIFLILIGLGSIFYVFAIFLPQRMNSPLDVVLEKNSFFEINAIREVNQTYITKREIIRRIREEILNTEGLNEGDISKIKISKDIEQEINRETITKTIEINTSDFFNIIEARVTDQLTRNLENEFLLGTHRVFGINEPFILFSIKDRDLIYSNMFNWEEYLVSDIKDIFFSKLGSSSQFEEKEDETISQPEDAPTAVPLSTTSTSTEISTTTNISTTTTIQPDEKYVSPRPSLNYDPLKFTDVVLSNRDTRAIVSDDGEILFFYSLIDSKRLLFANNLKTLEEVARKIKNENIVK